MLEWRGQVFVSVEGEGVKVYKDALNTIKLSSQELP